MAESKKPRTNTDNIRTLAKKLLRRERIILAVGTAVLVLLYGVISYFVGMDRTEILGIAVALLAVWFAHYNVIKRVKADSFQLQDAEDTIRIMSLFQRLLVLRGGKEFNKFGQAADRGSIVPLVRMLEEYGFTSRAQKA